MLHTQIKQIALIVVTKLNASSGINLLRRAPTDTTIVETINAFCGTLLRFNFANFGLACLFEPKLYSMRLVENIPEFPADAADVNTTKLIIPAAIGIPASVNTWTNGELSALIVFQGLIAKITNNAPT